MDTARKIAELEAERAELKKALAVPGISEAERIAIRQQVTATTTEITALYGFLPRPAAPAAPAAASNHHVRGPETDMQHLVARMTVRVEFTAAGCSGPCYGSGCIIDNKWTVIAARHVVEPWFNAPHAMCRCLMTDANGSCFTAAYSFGRTFGDDDIVTLVRTIVPGETLPSPCTAFFERRAMAFHLDNVFTGARGPANSDHATFVLSSGWFNYCTETTAFTSSWADEGWSGGPVFHFHDGTPTLCGIVQGRHGSVNCATNVQLLPQELLTDPRRSSRLCAQRVLTASEGWPVDCSGSQPSSASSTGTSTGSAITPSAASRR